jgi:hypothetical protein
VTTSQYPLLYVFALFLIGMGRLLRVVMVEFALLVPLVQEVFSFCLVDIALHEWWGELKWLLEGLDDMLIHFLLEPDSIGDSAVTRRVISSPAWCLISKTRGRSTSTPCHDAHAE